MHTHMDTCITHKYVDARKRTGSYRMNTPVRQAMANRLLEATLFDLCALLSWSLAKLGGENFGRRLSQVLLLFLGWLPEQFTGKTKTSGFEGCQNLGQALLQPSAV